MDVLAAEMDTLQDDLTPVGRSFGGSIAVVASIPFGSIREYFSARFGGGYELQLFCRNVTFMPSATVSRGTVKTLLSYDNKEFDDYYVMVTLDLAIGYRLKVFPKLSITPRGGLGLLKLGLHNKLDTGDYEDFFFGYAPTISAGIVFEHYYRQKHRIPNRRVAFYVDYRYILNAWEDRFKGSEIMFQLAIGIWRQSAS